MLRLHMTLVRINGADRWVSRGGGLVQPRIQAQNALVLAEKPGL